MGRKTTIVNNQKQCNKCLVWKDVGLFGTFKDNKTGKRYINSFCKKCAAMASKKWHLFNKEINAEKWQKKKNEYLQIIHKAYGSRCNCCGETNPLFLTLDHVNNDGYLERPRNGGYGYRKNEFSGHKYARIIKEGFPKDLQLLCWNCNCGRARNKGICPHKQ